MTGAAIQPPARHRFFTTADGVRIATQELGRPDGPPVLFIHGFSQCHLSWSHQHAGLADDFRLLSYDLRGHGGSDKPNAADYYADGSGWADELDGVFDHFALDRAVVVAWSYAGRVLSDYLHAHGTGRIAGINLVGSKTRSDRRFVGANVRETQAGMMSADIAQNVSATIAFLKMCAERWDADEFNRHLAFNMLVPAEIRGFLRGRDFDADAIYRTLDRPVLLTHGARDRVVPLAAAEASHALVAGSRLSIYEATGHSPFLEAPDRFNAELSDFVMSCDV